MYVIRRSVYITYTDKDTHNRDRVTGEARIKRTGGGGGRYKMLPGVSRAVPESGTFEIATTEYIFPELVRNQRLRFAISLPFQSESVKQFCPQRFT